MIYDLANMDPARAYKLGLLQPDEPAPGCAEGGGVLAETAPPNRFDAAFEQMRLDNQPKTLRFHYLLSSAINTYSARHNTGHSTKFVIHRVAKYPAFPGAIVRQMVQQAANQSEALAFAQQQPKLAKLISGAATCRTTHRKCSNATRGPDLVIEDDAGLTKQQFRDWFRSVNACKVRCCEVKHVFDCALARGDNVILGPGMTRNLTEPSVLVEVKRGALEAELPINAFQLVDPALQPEWANRTHEAAFPLYFQGIQTAEVIEHDILFLTARPARGQPTFQLFVDPTYRQVTPLRDITHNVNYWPMGPGIDAAYALNGRARLKVFQDDAPFTADNIFEIMARIFPCPEQLNYFCTPEDRNNFLENEMARLLYTGVEVLSAAYGRPCRRWITSE